MLSNKTALLSVACLGTVQYYTKLVSFPVVYIEKYENFIKQTYRNRFSIYAANGILSLTIPVAKGTIQKTLIKDIRISYDMNWQKLHWKSIESAYRSSPFFEYYIHEFIPFYRSKFQFLFEFNIEIQKVILSLLKIDKKVLFTDEFYKNGRGNIFDFRESIHPKKRVNKPDPDFHPVPYKQVFSSKHGFIGNLSIIDLLFNEGPNSYDILKSCCSINK